MRHFILFVGLSASICGLSNLRAQDSEFYKKPTNTSEYWRAMRFEIGVGKFDIAAAHLKGLLDSKPTDKDLLAIEVKDGLNTFLRLRNIERWSRDKAADKEARDNVEILIKAISGALKAELANPERIAKFAKNLTASPEEAAFALKELTRSGVEAVPVLLDMLRANQPAAQRAAILEALPVFDISVVPPLVAALEANEAVLKMELLDSLLKRTDFTSFSARVETDVIPWLWYLSTPLAKNPEPLRKRAREILFGLLDADPNTDRVLEHRLPQWRLAQIARTFLEHKARFSAADQAAVWKWDGEKPVLTPMSHGEAEEFYGLRYARWALEIQSDYSEAQKVFVTLALDKHFGRSGPDASLAKSSPGLYAILATAPLDFLTDLLEIYLRENRVPMAVALIHVIGDRTETKAARPSDKLDAPKSVTPDYRPSLLMKALDFPDRRVQFAAVDALLKTPGPHVHQRSATIVKILAGYLQADPPEEGAKPRALIGDADQLRAQSLAAVLRQAGFDAEISRTGKELIRRLQEKMNVDLILLDHHLPLPMMNDTLAQLRADFRTTHIPLLVVASPDVPTTAHPITLLARLAVLAAADEHVDIVKAQRLSDDYRRDLPSTRFKRRLDTIRKLVESAGVVVSQDVEDRLEYLVFLTTPPGEMFVEQVMERSKLVAPSPDRQNRMTVLLTDPKRGHILAGEAPFSNSRELTPRLGQVVSRYESNLPQEVLDVAKIYWKIMQNGQLDKDGKILQEPLPGVSIRYVDIETKLTRLTKQFKKTKVIPEVFTDEAVREELRGFVTIQDPKQLEADKKNNAKAAMEWLRKMAVGELTGYSVVEAEATLRQQLQKPEFAAMAIDAVSRLASKEAQQDIASVVLGNLDPVIRAQAADALIKGIQQRGKMISDPQKLMLLDKSATEADPEVRNRLLALRGILQPSAKETGARLLGFTPAPPAEAKEKKEAPKEP